MYLSLCYQNASSAYHAFHVGVVYTRIQSIFHLRYQNVLLYVEMLLIVSAFYRLRIFQE